MLKCLWFAVAFIEGGFCFTSLFISDGFMRNIDTRVLLVAMFLGLIQVFISSVGFYLSVVSYKQKKRKRG